LAGLARFEQVLHGSAMSHAATLQPLQAVIIPVTAYQQNCTLLWCTQTMRGALCDPGGDLDVLKRAVADNKVTLEKIILTHGHFDHCGLAGELARDLGVPIEGPHLDDSFWINQLGPDTTSYGVPSKTFTPDRWLKQGDTVTVGELVLDVYHCPGHTPGHVVFVHAPSRLALVGDVLFRGSIGRTDFPRGNHADLINAITTRLWPLGDDINFVPGHGGMSSFGHERKTNPFVADLVLKQ